jgi:hypothetical protein
MRRFLIAVAAVALWADVASAIDIVRCGQKVPNGDTATLQVDVDCSVLPGSCLADATIACTGQVDPACPPLSAEFPETALCSHSPIEFDHVKGTLDMNGHSIIGGDPGGMLCTKARCSIVGPGTITGALNGILVRKSRVTVTDVDLHDNLNGIVSVLGPS